MLDIKDFLATITVRGRSGFKRASLYAEQPGCSTENPDKFSHFLLLLEESVRNTEVPGTPGADTTVTARGETLEELLRETLTYYTEGERDHYTGEGWCEEWAYPLMSLLCQAGLGTILEIEDVLKMKHEIQAEVNKRVGLIRDPAPAR